MGNESKCPVAEAEGSAKRGKSDAMRAFANSDWWPDQLNLRFFTANRPRPIRWARRSTTPRNSRAST